MTSTSAPAPSAGRRLLAPLALALVAAAGLWLVFTVYASGQTLLALAALVLLAAGLYVYGARGVLAWRYLFPGIVGMGLFVAFPLLYTMQIGFTNYSSAHLLSQERVKAYLLEQTVPDEEHALEFALLPDPQDASRQRIVIGPHDDAAPFASAA
ncbi:MAG TPA: maltose ABC transporter permease MalF, partial [Burkholderiaceae bacterium]